MEVGFLGLGIMGKAMCMNLLRNGFKVTVWNRTLSKCEELVEHGASIGETPAAVVKKCKYTVAMLSDPSAALSVVFDKDGVLEQMGSGKGYIDMSTVDADTSTKISEGKNHDCGMFKFIDEGESSTNNQLNMVEDLPTQETTKSPQPSPEFIQGYLSAKIGSSKQQARQLEEHAGEMEKLLEYMKILNLKH